MSLRIELPYLPPVSWMTLVWNSPEATLEACEHFQKGSYRNRCHIAGPNGIQRLSIPLARGKNQQMPVREVRIAYDEPWQRQHLRSISTAYGNAPFYDHYRDGILPFFNKKYEFLFDFNFDLLQWVLLSIQCRTQIRLSESYLPDPARPFRNAILPDQGSPKTWFHPRPYIQVFADRYGFIPDLSVLDLLFCCGKNSGDWLEAPHKFKNT